MCIIILCMFCVHNCVALGIINFCLRNVTFFAALIITVTKNRKKF